LINSPAVRILIVDDERPIRNFLRISLASSYTVFEAENGLEALQMTAVKHPDLLILDLGLPDMDGLEVTRRLREWTLLPIIVVSVRDREEEKVAALDAGADDYLTKPFGIEEFLARIRVALRHKTQANGGTVRTLVHAGKIEVDLAGFVVKRDDTEVALTATEFKLLAYLASHAGRVLTHHMILSNVWDPAEADKIEYLRVYMRQLRKKLEDDPEQPKILLTEPGIGYRFNADE